MTQEPSNVLKGGLVSGLIFVTQYDALCMHVCLCLLHQECS